MKKWLPSLVLLLVTAAGTFAGVPLHFGESQCGMDGMMEMDCCKAALLQTETPDLADAKLCCALICAQNGSTFPTGSIRVTPPSAARKAFHPAIALPLPNPSLRFRRLDRLHGPPGATHLRHLALLI